MKLPGGKTLVSVRTPLCDSADATQRPQSVVCADGLRQRGSGSKRGRSKFLFYFISFYFYFILVVVAVLKAEKK
jgi:hypothetical protein